MQARRTAPVFLACLIAACAVEPGDEGNGSEGADVNEGTIDQAILSCPDWACGQNGPSLNNRSFHELAENGDVSPDGFAMSGLVQSSLVYSARVVGSKLYGVRTGSPTLTGAALTGAFFWVVHESGYAVKVYVTQVISVPMFGGPHQGAPVEAYRLEWQTPFDEHRTNLCANPPKDKPQTSNMLNLPGEFTVLFEGNRYDAKAKTLLPGNRNYFNIGCASHAISKLFLTGHTNVSGDSSEKEQQAALKMLTADYCGDGTSFTLGGEPLYWQTSNGYMSFFGNPTTLEARWNENGATCLERPRLKVSKNPLALQAFPDIWDAIRTRCPQSVPPPCSDLSPSTFDGQLVVSANPINE
jgi:hypothetical protein